MAKDVFPQLQALLENVDNVLDAIKPVITFSGLPDHYVRFWKVNYPKGSGNAKTEMLRVIMDQFFNLQNVVVREDGRVVSKLPANETKG